MKQPKNIKKFEQKQLEKPEPSVEEVMAAIPEEQPQPQASQGQLAWLWLVQMLNEARGLPCSNNELNPRMKAIADELNELSALKRK